jgi:hypothetical protein
MRSVRSETRPGIRSFDTRLSRGESRETPIANPLHVNL